MASTLSLDGVPAMLRRFRSLESQTAPALAVTLHEQAKEIMAISHELVPVRNVNGGTLQSSGLVFPAQRTATAVEVTLGYGASYAASVHANPRSGQTGGVSPSGHPYTSWAEVGQFHFLSTPMQHGRATVFTEVARTIRDLLRRQAG